MTRTGRPPGRKVTSHLQVRCSPEELERWRAAASAEDRTLSDWVRERLNCTDDGRED